MTVTSDITMKILFHSPALIKNVIISTYGLIEHRKRHGQFFYERYQALSALKHANPEAILAFQSERLGELLYEAFAYSSWYRGVFTQCGVTADVLASEPPMSVLQRLPFLEKHILKSQTRGLMSENPERQAFATVSTSGTSGSPMQVVFDAEGRQGTYAEWRRYHDWLGLPERFRSVRFSGRIIVDPAATRPPFWAYNCADQQLFMSTYHLKKDYLPAYIARLNAFKPQLIDGYPSALYILAQYLLQMGTRLDFTPMAISLTAETLMDHQRRVIEQAFGCKVYNQYASSEGAPWIAECREGNYHLWLETGVFEFIDPQPLDADTDMAELVVTSFRNFKTPLIRYRIGDYVEIYKHPPICPCGAPYPVIKGIIGRNDDILFTEDKGSVGRLDPAYKGVEGIRQSKIIQHSLDRLEVLVVPDECFDPSQQALLLQNLRDRLGQVINIEFTFCESIPLGKTGKLKSVERRFPIPESS